MTMKNRPKHPTTTKNRQMESQVVSQGLEMRRAPYIVSFYIFLLYITVLKHLCTGTVVYMMMKTWPKCDDEEL